MYSCNLHHMSTWTYGISKKGSIMERTTYISMESALPNHQLDNISTVVLNMPTLTGSTYGDVLDHASKLYTAYNNIREHDVISSSIVSGMLHATVIDSAILRMAIYEYMGSITNTMYPDGVIMVKYTDTQLVKLNQCVDTVMAKQKHIHDAMANLKLNVLSVNYDEVNMDKKITNFINETYGW